MSGGKFPFSRLFKSKARPPAPEVLQLGERQVNFIARLSRSSGLPPSALLNNMIDCAAYHAKAAALDGLFAALIGQMEAQAAAPARGPAAVPDPPAETPAPEEMAEGSAEDRLNALREQAGLDTNRAGPQPLEEINRVS